MMAPITAIDIQTYLSEQGAFVDELLDRYLPSASDDPKRLHEAMRYSVMAGGKRIRPIIAFTSYSYCQRKETLHDTPIFLAMAALEMVHTYSLIHDDLPCMDDDDLRRGIPTCHRKFDEATAVLAGDALHDIAFELLARTGNTEAVAELAFALGTQGMIGGQEADVLAEGRDLSKDEIIAIHSRKTGMLIRCAVRLGGLLSSADPQTMKALSIYGEKIGLAFQIIDDILDVEGDQQALGKSIGSDSKMKKATYPSVVGIKQAREDATVLIDQAIEQIDPENGQMLVQLATFIGQRDR